MRLFFLPVSLLIILAAGGAGAYFGMRTPVVVGAVLVFALLILCGWVLLEQYRPRSS